MKITPILLTLPFLTGLVFADEKKKAPKDAPKAVEEKSEKPAPAEGSWEAVESMLNGPKKQPASRAEAEDIYKDYLSEYDKAAAAFTKANPNDARRWKLALHEVRLNGVRGALKVNPKSEEDVKKLLTGIAGAEDADKETKGQASFMLVMESKDNAEEFTKLAEVHMKAYPDLPVNQAIERQIKTLESDKALKEKPMEMTFKATDGTEVDLSKMRGKVVLIDFWATWCGPCVAELPNVLKTYKALHDKGFEIIGISFDQDKKKLDTMTKEKEMPWPQYFDGEGWKNKFGTQYGIDSIPRMWLIDKKGMVVDTNARQDLEKKVEKLLAE